MVEPHCVYFSGSLDNVCVCCVGNVILVLWSQICNLSSLESHSPFPIPHSQSKETGEITFYMKGADTVMANIVQYSDWLEEEVCALRSVLSLFSFPLSLPSLLLPFPLQCGNMAREGLRTLVVGKKVLTDEQYITFEVSYN